MSGSPRQIFVITIGAICLVVVGLVSALLWPQIEREYFLYQLRSDPSRLEEMLSAAHPSARQAARKFSREEAGKKWLFALYLKEYDRSSSGNHLGNLLIRRRSSSTDFRGFLALWGDGFSYQSWTGPTSQGSLSYTTAPKDHERRQKVLALMASCVGESFQPEAFKGFEFQIARVTDGTAKFPSWPRIPGSSTLGFLPFPPSSLNPAVEYVCFFRRSR